VTSIKLKHLERFVDRHGKVRFYFRRGKGPRTPIHGVPGSHEFMTAYQAALAKPLPKAAPRFRGAEGTFDRLVQEYFTSSDYVRLTMQSQMKYRSIIERFVEQENIGHRKVSEMTRLHIQKILAKRAATPAAANDVLKKLRILIHFAIDNGWRKDDPTLRIKKYAGGEFHSWTDEEIEVYERRWQIGSKECTAFGLLLFTGQRASDVAKMDWSDVSEDGIWVVQRKTKAKLLVPIHPSLQAILEAWGSHEGPVLQTAFGRAFTAKGMSNFMAERIDQAGLPERCVTHGLRKAAARRLAEAGCSANEIAAITGHVSLEEVARYTRAAEQKRLARAAMDRLVRGQPASEIPNPADTKFPNQGRFGKDEAKTPNEIKPPSEVWRSLRESNPSFQIENLTS